jgi:hypothetical protein
MKLIQLQLETLATQTTQVFHLPLPNLTLGEAQDIVNFDKNDNIVGYGKMIGEGDLVQYDQKGNPLNRTRKETDGSVSLVNANGHVESFSWRTPDGTVQYYDAEGHLTGTTTAINEFFVEYRDAKGEKLGTAIVNQNSATYIDAQGKSTGRRVSRTCTGRDLAMQQAWNTFQVQYAVIAWAA